MPVMRRIGAPVLAAPTVAREGRTADMVYQERLTVATRGHGDMHDLTEQAAAVVARSKVRTGVAHVFNVGSTAAVGTVEFEPGLRKDLPATLDRLMPPSREYGHEQTWHDGNGHSHLQATLLGPSLTVPVAEGKLLLGTWQQIFHLECDIRPRRREVVVTVMGE
jgi:secondary thiamine-phosphate synthase enzyme